MAGGSLYSRHSPRLWNGITVTTGRSGWGGYAMRCGIGERRCRQLAWGGEPARMVALLHFNGGEIGFDRIA